MDKIRVNRENYLSRAAYAARLRFVIYGIAMQSYLIALPLTV